MASRDTFWFQGLRCPGAAGTDSAPALLSSLYRSSYVLVVLVDSPETMTDSSAEILKKKKIAIKNVNPSQGTKLNEDRSFPFSRSFRMVISGVLGSPPRWAAARTLHTRIPKRQLLLHAAHPCGSGPCARVRGRSSNQWGWGRSERGLRAMPSGLAARGEGSAAGSGRYRCRHCCLQSLYS